VLEHGFQVFGCAQRHHTRRAGGDPRRCKLDLQTRSQPPAAATASQPNNADAMTLLMADRARSHLAGVPRVFERHKHASTPMVGNVKSGREQSRGQISFSQPPKIGIFRAAISGRKEALIGYISIFELLKT
jgi:hypothetical protein